MSRVTCDVVCQGGREISLEQRVRCTCVLRLRGWCMCAGCALFEACTVHAYWCKGLLGVYCTSILDVRSWLYWVCFGPL